MDGSHALLGQRCADSNEFAAHVFIEHGTRRPRAMTTLRIVVLGCVLAAVAITLKIRLDTPEGPQPLARAIITTHLHKLREEMALP
jgi:hypothetical protein